MTTATETPKRDLRESVTIPLKFPISVDGQEYREFTMRRPKVKDSRWGMKQPGNDFDQGVLMLARLCDVSPEHIDELDDVDAEALQEQLNRFRGGAA